MRRFVPDNVEKVVALAPTRFPPVASVPSYPMNMSDKRDFFADWDRQIDSKNCPQQVDPSIRQALWDSTIARDKLGSGWGASGVRRSPAFTAVGWTPDLPGPRSGADARYTRSARRPSARASDTRSLRRARWPEGVRDRDLWKPRARLRETAHDATASFRGVAPVWHVPRGVRRARFRSDRAPRRLRFIRLMLAHAVNLTDEILRSGL